MLNKTDLEYHRVLKLILENGKKKGDRTGTGTLSLFGTQIRFNLQEEFPLITTKKLHLKSIIHELLWFLSGDTNIKYLKENGISIWDEWADENGDLGPVYGKQWVDWDGYEKTIFHTRHYGGSFGGPVHVINEGSDKIYFNGINQIQQAIDLLNNNPDSRRIMISAWNVKEIDRMKLPPCHYGFQLYSEELTKEEQFKIWNEIYDGNDEILGKNLLPKRKLSLLWNQRSVDTFLGLPFNIASYAFLLEMFSQQTNHISGELIGNLGDTHLYLNHLDYVEKQLKRESKSKPTVKINKAENMFDYKYEDFEIIGYDPHPNWKNVPIAV